MEVIIFRISDSFNCSSPVRWVLRRGEWHGVWEIGIQLQKASGSISGRSLGAAWWVGGARVARNQASHGHWRPSPLCHGKVFEMVSDDCILFWYPYSASITILFWEHSHRHISYINLLMLCTIYYKYVFFCHTHISSILLFLPLLFSPSIPITFPS